MRLATRFTLFAATILLALPGLASADPPPAPKAPARLKLILAEWEKEIKSIREIHYTFKKTFEDVTLKTKQVAKGQVLYRRPDLLRIDANWDNGDSEFVLFESRKLHIFAKMEETIFDVPSEFGFPLQPERYPKETLPNQIGGGILEALALQHLPLPVRELEENCDIVVKTDSPQWIILEMTPRTPRFKGSFNFLQVLLVAQTCDMRRLFLQQPNGSTLMVEVEGLAINPREPITPQSIRKGLPQGWKLRD